MKQVIYLITVILLSYNVLHAQRTITGVITDESGDPIPGAVIMVKGTETGTITRLDGDYSLNIPGSATTLIFSYIGKRTQQIKINDKLIINVILESEDVDLDEVVVTSIGVKRIKKCMGYSATDASGEPSNRSTLSLKVSGIKVDSTNTAVKSGLLTAGELNDFSKWELWTDISKKEFLEYKNRWLINPQKIFCIQLSSQNGKPIINSTVRLIDKNKNIIRTARTDNTGKAELWANLFDTTKLNNRKLSVEIEYLGEKYIIKRPKEIKKGINKKIINTECNVPNIVDIAFVIDATGSMTDEIEYLKAELEDVIKNIKKKHKEIQINLASVFYRDVTESYLTRKSNFTDSIELALDFIKNQTAAGGGDFPEAFDEGFSTAVNQLNWSQNTTAKIMFLILDAPPHDNRQVKENLRLATEKAAKLGIRIVPITCSGIGKSTEYLMRSLALATNGTYVFLTDDSGIGNAHIEPTTDSYTVEPLNDILIRIISQYSVTPTCKNTAENEDSIQTAETDSLSINENDISVYQSDFFTDTEEKTDSLISKIILYPNPTQGIVNIESSLQNKDFFLFDLSGKLLEKFKNEKQRFKINLSEYPTGIYFLRFSNKNKTKSRKIILLH